MGLRGEPVQFGAIKPPAGGHEFGGDALAHQAVRIAGAHPGAELVLSLGRGAERDATHDLDAAGQYKIVGTGDDPVSREGRRLLS